MASWGRSLWHRPSSVQHQLGTLPSDTPGPVTSSPGPQAFTARTTDRPSALLPDSLPPDALPAGGAGWGRAWASAGRPPPGARGRAGGRVGPPIPEPHASPGLFSPESLSELREYSEGLGEPTGADDCVPPAAGQSVISLLSSKELQQLIEEVRVLDEATLKQLDSIHVTVLHKEEGAGLGFSLAGGADLENKVVTVSGPGTGPREGDRSPGRVLCWVRGMQGSQPLIGSWLSGHSNRHVTPDSAHITILREQGRSLGARNDFAKNDQSHCGVEEKSRGLGFWGISVSHTLLALNVQTRRTSDRGGGLPRLCDQDRRPGRDG
ncbi:uncharacterized protein LOC111729088 isoform X1 [Pteropus vampyrus]|uniref:Pro-interleukin-16 n=1 Tax=Pteropus vampyrus TaxID=132908 RepID=A0A6P6BL79_PTEVA|nr:uncharacterized protein LOC111729088 isoform X1 [Pteropus vampyrus]